MVLIHHLNIFDTDQKALLLDFLLDTSNPVRFVGYDFQTIRDKGNRRAARPIPAIHSIPGRAVRPVHARLRNRVDKIAVVQQVVRLQRLPLIGLLVETVALGVSVMVIRPLLPPLHRLQLTHSRRKKPMRWSAIAHKRGAPTW